ncbi:MAG TPA: hypothetical protein VNU74_04230 [Terriglobales bacterium]|jgi:ABC-type antimicrobial peptide transport system permease subunit|nr:hypothetical protein [Terriglobales bacterium]
MSGLLRDLRYAAGQLRKNPGFTAVGVIALALGVGLSTTIFSIFYNGVLNPYWIFSLAALSVRIVKSQLWGISAFDVGTFLLVPLALMATGLLASYIPARRATRVDPMVALRHE